MIRLYRSLCPVQGSVKSPELMTVELESTALKEQTNCLRRDSVEDPDTVV